MTTHRTTDEITATEASAIPAATQRSKDGHAGTEVEPLEVSGGDEASARTRSKLNLCAIILMLSLVLFVGALDQTIVATAIPSITKDLQSAAGYTWIGAAYLLANTTTSSIWTRISDIWGRKPGILGAIVIFAIGSTLAAAARNMAMLITGRVVQGLAASGMFSSVPIVISDLFSIRKRSLYIGLTAFVWILAGATGPVIGGAFSQYLSWRWCFWINLPVCFVAFFVLFFFLDLYNPGTKLADGLKAVDWWGTGSLLAVILLILLGLDFGGVTYAWNSPTVICMVVFGTALIGFFLLAEKRLARFPLVDLRIFQDKSNNAVVIVAVAHSVATRGAEFYLPLYFQSVMEASPTKSGFLILPMMIAASVVDLACGVLIHRTGRYRELTWAGVVFLTAGTILYAFLGIGPSLGMIIGYQIVGGVGLSLLLMTPMLAIQNNVRQADVAVATSTLTLMRNIASSLSNVLGGVVFQDSMSDRHSSLVAAGLSSTYLAAFSGSDAAASVDLISGVTNPVQHAAVQNAYAWSMRNVFLMYAALSGLGLLASPLIKQRHMSEEHTETKTGIENMTDNKRRAC